MFHCSVFFQIYGNAFSALDIGLLGYKVRFSAQINFVVFVYFCVQATLNLLVAILVFPFLHQKFPQELNFEFVFSFLTVFGVEAFVRYTNITMFDAGILSVQDWLNKVKE